MLKFALDSFTSVEDSLDPNNQEVKVYPNPTSNILIIQGIENLKGEMTISNSIGQVVKDVKSSESENNQLTVDLSNLDTGVYYLRVGSTVKKFSKL